MRKGTSLHFDLTDVIGMCLFILSATSMCACSTPKSLFGLHCVRPPGIHHAESVGGGVSRLDEAACPENNPYCLVLDCSVQSVIPGSGVSPSGSRGRAPCGVEGRSPWKFLRISRKLERLQASLDLF